MAAWTCKVESVDSDGKDIFVFCSYWLQTDTQFTNQLHGERFTFRLDSTLTPAQQQTQMALTVKNAGASARSVLGARDSLLPQVGTTLNIP